MGLVDDSLFEWELLLVGPADTLYEGTYVIYIVLCLPFLSLHRSPSILPSLPSLRPSCAGGFFKARLAFPNDFPNMPPTMTFQTEMWHPNGEEGGREGRREGGRGMLGREEGKGKKGMCMRSVSLVPFLWQRHKRTCC